MRKVLPVKYLMKNEAVWEVWNNIQMYVTREEIEEAICAAVAEIKRVLHFYPNAGYGWSGGKDSIALQVVLERVGEIKNVTGCTQVEFPVQDAWVLKNRPAKNEIIRNPDVTLSWLRDHPKRLFPKSANPFWTRISTRRAQYIYQDRHTPDLLILGRRRIDGNIIYSHPPFDIHVERKHNMRQYSPLRSWTHEMVLATIKYFYGEENIPPYVHFPNGWVNGDGAWAGMLFPTKHEGWEYVYKIDPGIVKRAALQLPSAGKFLQTRKI